MPLPTFLLIAVVVEVFFGVQFLLVPNMAVAPLGASLNPAGALLARLFGGALLGFAFLFWRSRTLAPSEARTAIFCAATVFYVASGIALIIGVASGITNALGWLIVAVHSALTFGFWHFGCRKAV